MIKLVSMKKKPMPKHKLRTSMAEPEMSHEPQYPWGLEINLENESVKKLGIDMENISAGDMVHLVAKANITSVSRRQNMEKGSSKTNDSISLQITDMAFNVPLK